MTIPDKFLGKWKSINATYSGRELTTTFNDIIIEKNLLKICTESGAIEIDGNNLKHINNSIEATSSYIDDENNTIDIIYIITINNNELQLSQKKDPDLIYNYNRTDDLECPSLGDVLGYNLEPHNLKVGISYKLFNVNTNSIERTLSLSYEEFLETNQNEFYNYTDEFGNEYIRDKVYFPQKLFDEYDIKKMLLKN